MTARTPAPLPGIARSARIDRAYRRLHDAIRKERKAALELEKARAQYLETITADLEKRLA